MRINAGQWKGRTLLSVKGLNTRPTSDMVKQAIFNILQGQIQDKDFLDLYAGTGSIAFEALSRGARSAILVEKDRAAVDVIRKNAEYLGCRDSVRVMANDVLYAAKLLSGKKFDIIFLDPPYGMNLELPTLEAVLENGLLRKSGIVIVQYTAEKHYSFEVPQELTEYDTRKYGKTALKFFALAEERNEEQI